MYRGSQKKQNDVDHTTQSSLTFEEDASGSKVYPYNNIMSN